MLVLRHTVPHQWRHCSSRRYRWRGPWPQSSRREAAEQDTRSGTRAESFMARTRGTQAGAKKGCAGFCPFAAAALAPTSQRILPDPSLHAISLPLSAPALVLWAKASHSPFLSLFHPASPHHQTTTQFAVMLLLPLLPAHLPLRPGPAALPGGGVVVVDMLVGGIGGLVPAGRQASCSGGRRRQVTDGRRG